MENEIFTIGYIGLLLLLGLISSIISRRLKIPNLLFLIGAGMALGAFQFKGKPIIEFSPIFLTGIAVITLAMVVFDASSKFNFKRFDSMSASALKLSFVFLILNMIILSSIARYLFDFPSLILAVIFAAVVSGTDPSSTLMVLSGARSSLFELLKVEAIVNTPLIVLIPFLLVDVMKDFSGSTLSLFIDSIIPFTQQFVVGIGTGILIGLIFFRFMKKYYSQTLSPLAMITSALLAYVIAEALGGNGVLSVTTAGLMFGNIYQVKHMRKLQEFGEIFSEVLQILVLILVGSIIKIPWNREFLIPASLLFVGYLIIRFLAVQLSFIKSKYNFKEKLYLTLNIPKGIAVAVVVFTLATQSIEGMGMVVNLIFLFLIYSILLSTLVTHYSKFFTKIDIKINEEQ